MRRAVRESPDSVLTKIFEAGFGTGYYLDMWRQLGVTTVTGIDLSSDAVAFSQARHSAYEIRQADLTSVDTWSDWPGHRGIYSLALAIDVLYHIVDDADATHAVRNLARLVKPGGYVWLTEKFKRTDTRRNEGAHVRRRSREWYEAILREEGLVPDREYPVFFCMDPPLLYGRPNISTMVGYALWVAIRLPLRCLPRRSRAQEVCGWILGTVGLVIDHLFLDRISSPPNLVLATYRLPYVPEGV